VSDSSNKTNETSSLDTLTGGAFSTATSGDRTARLREWLLTDPPFEQLQSVATEMSVRDKGAARVVRERLDELRRVKEQDALVQTWVTKGEALRDTPRIQIADALAWQRDAAKAGAPLSREPLASLKHALADRVKAIEDLQHQAQVEREAAVLLAQRIEVLSTKSWQDAWAQREALQADLLRWQTQVQALMADPQWASVDLKFTPALQISEQQVRAVWEAFDAALKVTHAASLEANAALPDVPAWADQLRVARGEVVAQVASAKAQAPRIDATRTLKPTADKAEIDAKRLALCEQAEALFKQQPVLTAASEQTADTSNSEAPAMAAADAPTETPTDAVAAEPQVQWVPVVTGRKLQDNLRQLRDHWKKIDKEAAPNPALWKRFDTACNRAHAVVDAWLKEIRAQSTASKAQRLALIEEVKAWTATSAQGPDWKAVSRQLHQFSQRWREGGHLNEKLFAELQPIWKSTIHAAHEPLEAAQKATLVRRKALIDEAHALAAEPRLRLDAVKALQQRWQEEAHAVPIDRRQEQKLWDAFRQPLDQAFANRKPLGRDKAPQQDLSPLDRAVVDAAHALEAAAASGDAKQIQQAMAALERISRGEVAASAPVTPAPSSTPATEPTAAPVEASTASTDAVVQEDSATPDAASSETAEASADVPSDTPVAATPAKAPAAPRTVVAVRGDDRPGQKRPEAAPARGREGQRDRPRDRKDGDKRFERDGDRPARGPRLGDAAFRAQRHALEAAQTAMRRLAAQAHGEVLTQLMQAWAQRDAAQLPSAQALGSRLAPAQRSQWVQALQAPAAGDASEALLRLEMAADLPTPAADLPARRALQLQLLTRRNDPSPTQTWASDAAKVLAGAHQEATARRLQAALKVLLKR